MSDTPASQSATFRQRTLPERLRYLAGELGKDRLNGDVAVALALGTLAEELDAAGREPVDGVYVRPTEYQVSVFPDEMHDSGDMLISSEAHTWSLTVAYRGCGKWAVTNGPGARQVLGTDGEWDWEPIPSSREDDWLATHRFSLDEALRLAREHAPKVTINGYTALDILAKLRKIAVAREPGPGEAGHPGPQASSDGEDGTR